MLLVLIAIRNIHSGKKYKLLCGIIILFPTFSFAGLFLFIPILSYFYDTSKKTKIINYIPSKISLGLLIYSVIYFVFSRAIFDISIL